MPAGVKGPALLVLGLLHCKFHLVNIEAGNLVEGLIPEPGFEVAIVQVPVIAPHPLMFLRPGQEMFFEERIQRYHLHDLVVGNIVFVPHQVALDCNFDFTRYGQVVNHPRLPLAPNGDTHPILPAAPERFPALGTLFTFQAIARFAGSTEDVDCHFPPPRVCT